jgi:hypothetical protein
MEWAFIQFKGKPVERQGRKVTDPREKRDGWAAWNTNCILGGNGMGKLELEGLDYEWLELIRKALQMGLSEDEIREFLATKQRV